MNKINAYKIALLLSVTFVISVTSGCSNPGGSSRKKMPELNTFDGIEGPSPGNYGLFKNNAASYAFSPVNESLTINGQTQQAVMVALPDRRNDSLAVSLLRNFRPLALPLLAAWAQQQRHIVELDLRSGRGDGDFRTEFSLGNQNDINVPIILLWDQHTAARLIPIKKIIDEVPELHFTYKSGDNPASLFSNIK